MSKQLFRYAACGGGNIVLDWILYFLIYNFVIGHDLVYINLSPISYHLCLTPHIATLCIVFPIRIALQAMLEKKAVMSRKRGRLVGFLYLRRQCGVSHEV